MKQKKGPFISSVSVPMNPNKHITRIPWDSKIFGIDAYEIKSPNDEVLKLLLKKPGHYTVKVDPLFPKKILQDYGFYYCDTLIEPFCTVDRFVYFRHNNVIISRTADINVLSDMSGYAFYYGRFHRDFNIDKKQADLRYAEWLRKLQHSGKVFTLLFNNDICGFFAYVENKIVLHAINEKYKGKGLAKYMWSVACKELFDKGYKELISSISSANIPVLNLYASLGFRFRNPLDVYHKLVAG